MEKQFGSTSAHPLPKGIARVFWNYYSHMIISYLIAGGDVLTGHDPQSGKEIWRWGTWNPNHKEQWWRLVPSPVVGKGVILVCAPKKAPIFAIKTGLKGIMRGAMAYLGRPKRTYPYLRCPYAALL